jgi:hypothetical protein
MENCESKVLHGKRQDPRIAAKNFVITSCKSPLYGRVAQNAYSGREGVRLDIHPARTAPSHNGPLDKRTYEVQGIDLRYTVLYLHHAWPNTKASSAAISNIIGTSVCGYILIRFCWIAPRSIPCCLSSLSASPIPCL